MVNNLREPKEQSWMLEIGFANQPFGWFAKSERCSRFSGAQIILEPFGIRDSQVVNRNPNNFLTKVVH